VVHIRVSIVHGLMVHVLGSIVHVHGLVVHVLGSIVHVHGLLVHVHIQLYMYMV
jgi:hypothetical protein